jgi:hypothetical protein
MVKLLGQPKPANWARRENWADSTEEFKLTLPNQTYNDKLTYYDDETAVELIHLGPAHTNAIRSSICRNRRYCSPVRSRVWPYAAYGRPAMWPG